MKTPDEIKKVLRLCGSAWKKQNCHECSYAKKDCRFSLHDDTLALIQQLERELDAAKADLALMAQKGECIVCGHYRTDWPKPGCELNGLTCAWIWRGVQDAGQD